MSDINNSVGHEARNEMYETNRSVYVDGLILFADSENEIFNIDVFLIGKTYDQINKKFGYKLPPLVKGLGSNGKVKFTMTHFGYDDDSCQRCVEGEDAYFIYRVRNINFCFHFNNQELKYVDCCVEASPNASVDLKYQKYEQILDSRYLRDDNTSNIDVAIPDFPTAKGKMWDLYWVGTPLARLDICFAMYKRELNGESELVMGYYGSGYRLFEMNTRLLGLTYSQLNQVMSFDLPRTMKLDDTNYYDAFFEYCTPSKRLKFYFVNNRLEAVSNEIVISDFKEIAQDYYQIYARRGYGEPKEVGNEDMPVSFGEDGYRLVWENLERIGMKGCFELAIREEDGKKHLVMKHELSCPTLQRYFTGLKCAKCGNVISNRSTCFCKHCGTKISVCANCGRLVDTHYEFCGNCGFSFSMP